VAEETVLLAGTGIGYGAAVDAGVTNGSEAKCPSKVRLGLLGLLEETLRLLAPSEVGRSLGVLAGVAVGRTL
jgi:hypothetical protein